ncbi:uncharacterized protein LOC110333776 [Mus pahari]|uniref:uncharacterized protein LOC110333776 n=1 Tax=Mus pahari TaxID=10093 RepID=UPI000A304B5D|nr:uncharacterized protein LOC110333776 [Mus pahari]
MVLPGSPMDQKTPFFPFARLANGVLSLLHSWVHRTPKDAPPRRRRVSSKAGGKNKTQPAFRRELPCSCGRKRKEDMVKAKALWIDPAAAAPTQAPRKNSGPGDDQGRVSYRGLLGADLAPRSRLSFTTSMPKTK